MPLVGVASPLATSSSCIDVGRRRREATGVCAGRDLRSASVSASQQERWPAYRLAGLPACLQARSLYPCRTSHRPSNLAKNGLMRQVKSTDFQAHFRAFIGAAARSGSSSRPRSAGTCCASRTPTWAPRPRPRSPGGISFPPTAPCAGSTGDWRRAREGAGPRRHRPQGPGRLAGQAVPPGGLGGLRLAERGRSWRLGPPCTTHERVKGERAGQRNILRRRLSRHQGQNATSIPDPQSPGRVSRAPGHALRDTAMVRPARVRRWARRGPAAAATARGRLR